MKKKKSLFIDREFAEEQFEKDLTPDPMNLQTDNVNQPGLHYYYGRLVEDAEDACDRAVLKLEVHEADLAGRFQASELNHGRSITESAIKRKFRQNGKWMRLKKAVMQKKRTLGLLKKAFEAIKDKRSSIINLGTLYREDPEVYLMKEKLREKKSRKKKK